MFTRMFGEPKQTYKYSNFSYKFTQTPTVKLMPFSA